MFVQILIFGCVFSFGCIKSRSPEKKIINVSYIYVYDKRFPSISNSEINDFLNESTRFYKEQTGINLQFHNNGPLPIESFFSRNLDPIVKNLSKTRVEIPNDKENIDKFREIIISYLKKENLQLLNKVIKRYSHEEASSYEHLFEIIKSLYLSDLSKVRSNEQIYSGNLPYQSKAKWSSALNKIDDQTLLITNTPIIEDFIDPSHFYLYVGGAIAVGFSGPGETLLVSLYPFLVNSQISNSSRPVVSELFNHELGHSIFYFPDTFYDTGSVMSYDSSAELIKMSQETKLSEEEKVLAQCAFQMYMGNVSLKRGIEDEAINSFNAAKTICPNTPYPFEALAKHYLEKRDWVNWENTLLEAIKVHPDHEEFYVMIGKLYSINPLSEPNAINKSIDAYNKAIEINPFLIKARIQLAYSYEGSGKKDQALNQYNEVLFYDPMNTVALKQIGIMSSHDNNCSALNLIYEKLLKLEPAYAEAYYRLGLCYLNIDKGNARKYLDRYLDLEPDGEYSVIAKNMEKRL